MKPGLKPLDWLLLALALATFIVAILSFADFSGKPAPRWREIFMIAGPALTFAVVTCRIWSGRYK